MKLSDNIPQYLRGKGQLISMESFVAFFAVTALILMSPLMTHNWFVLTSQKGFALTATFFLLMVAVMILSKRLLYMTRNTRMTILQYILWNIAEMLVISLIYASLTNKAGQEGIADLSSMTFGGMLQQSLTYMAVAVAIPDIIAVMYLVIEDKDNTIRLMNYESVVSDEPVKPTETNKITLFDNNGALKLSVNLNNLFYIESDDNYVKVWYADSNNELKQYMLRCRLKTIEDSFVGSDLERCHRKYIVNMTKVKVLHRQKEGYVLDLDLDDQRVQQLPVSKTYEERILARFNPGNQTL